MKLSGRATGVAARATLLVGGLVVLSGVAGRLALEALRAPRTAVAEAGLSGLTTVPFAQALTALCAAAVLLCWLWLAASIATVAVGTTLATLRPGTRARAAAPRAVRRFVAVCLGVTVCATAPVAAHATTFDHSTSGTGHAPTAGLTGLALPDRVPSPRRAVVRVRAGDTLWAIARRELTPTAPDAAVDRAWRRLARANADRLGDPDLIFPGTVLRVPDLDRPSRKEAP